MRSSGAFEPFTDVKLSLRSSPICGKYSLLFWTPSPHSKGIHWFVLSFYPLIARLKEARSWNFTYHKHIFKCTNGTKLGLFWVVHVRILGLVPKKRQRSIDLDTLGVGPKSILATWGTFRARKQNVYRRRGMYQNGPFLCGNWRLTMLDARLK